MKRLFGVACVWLLLLACSSDPPPSSAAVVSPAPLVHGDPETLAGSEEPQGEVVADVAAIDGRGLYLRNCAGCHNENGDGRGKTMVDLGTQARSFAQGGFAFGNTPEAIYKTITAGLPGSSLMPSFKGTLSEEERREVVRYVLTLAPPQPEAARGTEIVVRAVACVARGKLPAFAESLPERPRGLLIGLPEGFTFEYRIDDVRMLGVRQGAFADRTDWDDRGGGVLQPLGTIVYALGGGDPAAPFELASSSASVAGLSARLQSTWVGPGGPGLGYSLRSTDGAVLASIEERPVAESLSIGGAFTRRFRGQASRQVRVRAWLADGGANQAVEGMQIEGQGGKGESGVLQNPSSAPERGEEGRARPTVGDSAQGLRRWFVHSRGDGIFECVHVRAPLGARFLESDRVGLELELGAEPASWSVSVVRSEQVNARLLVQWEQELAP